MDAVRIPRAYESYFEFLFGADGIGTILGMTGVFSRRLLDKAYLDVIRLAEVLPDDPDVKELRNIILNLRILAALNPKEVWKHGEGNERHAVCFIE